MSRQYLAAGGAMLLALAISASARAQSFGVELHNTLMPVAGGMGGASIALPQDLTSGIAGNPATLTQFPGTQFLFGGAWAEPTFVLDQTSPIPLLGVDPFDAKSTAPGGAAGNIGVTQDLSALGMPATFGLGFTTAAAGVVDFRNTPESNGTNSALTVFEMTGALGADLTDRLSVGAALALGIAFFDGPFVEIGGLTMDYALRGTLGVNYALTDWTSAGFYYQTPQHFKFDNAITFAQLPIGPQDVRLDLPTNLGFGIANSALAGGNLLIAFDVLYKLWDDTQLFGAVYDNQWVFQVGAQYTSGQNRLRAGYAYAQSPLDPNPGPNLGGIAPPGGFPAIRYSQALLTIANPHRISFGIGRTDVLPGIDMDLMAGGMLRSTDELGRDTTVMLTSYWIGFGLTWRFGRGACCTPCVPDSWACDY